MHSNKKTKSLFCSFGQNMRFSLEKYSSNTTVSEFHQFRALMVQYKLCCTQRLFLDLGHAFYSILSLKNHHFQTSKKCEGPLNIFFLKHQICIIILHFHVKFEWFRPKNEDFIAKKQLNFTSPIENNSSGLYHPPLWRF